ncbi:MAG: class I SAM-dependent rRNA methyltransferase [Lactobacillales bacterium]|jgi:23S rRNA (cytosine1962-C5)-methyltransferase|nr:class I SAM-dependent rRNA methyltransferase [Lactobacillales bacterium]
MQKVNITSRSLLIREEDVHGAFADNNWAETNQGLAYFSKQNKGIGWLVESSDFSELIKRASEKRHFDDLTTAYRVFNTEGDGFPGLTIDLYNEFLVVSFYNEFVYSLRDEIVSACKAAFPDVVGAYAKIRFASDLPESSKLYGEDAPEPLVILENGVKYATYLNEGFMTGIFLDQHEVRGRLVDGLASGKTLLNMFSYTGAFSVAAAMGGAVQTTSVDLAKRSREKTAEHFELNGFDVSSQLIYVMDVFEYYKYAARKGLKYDVIVIDPPSFAKNKKMIFTVKKDYGRLIENALEILSDDGIIIASTNASDLPKKKFRAMIEDELEAAGVEYRFDEFYSLPSDFATSRKYDASNYLKVYVIGVKK